MAKGMGMRVWLSALSLLFLAFATPLAPAVASAAQMPGDADPLVAPEIRHADLIERVLRDLSMQVLADPVLLQSLRHANNDNDILTEDQIIQRDINWRLQSKRGKGALLRSVLSGPASQRLVLLRFPRAQLLADIMLMDDRGLLVAATRLSSDYDQSDEAKYRRTFPLGPGVQAIEEAAYDESADEYVLTASLSLADPDSKAAIGVVTVNFSLAALDAVK